MQRNYKLIVSIIALTVSSLCAFAQDKVEYKDVVLDGKPAKLNVATGEITLVNPVEKKIVKTVKVAEPIEVVTEEADTETGSDFYIVKKGETLLKIANKFQTSLTALKRANDLETTLIDEGQWLKVKNLFGITTSSDVPSNTNSTTNSKVHIVEKGQTLYSISRRYNTSVSALKTKNSLTSNTINIGQKILVSTGNRTQEAENVTVWAVSKGETLYSIARKNGITVAEIKRLNGLTGNIIRVGQKLQLNQNSSVTKK